MAPPSGVVPLPPTAADLEQRRMTELFTSWSLNPAFAEVSRDNLMGMAIKAAADERERQERLQLDREKWEYDRAR